MVDAERISGYWNNLDMNIIYKIHQECQCVLVVFIGLAFSKDRIWSFGRQQLVDERKRGSGCTSAVDHDGQSFMLNSRKFPTQYLSVFNGGVSFFRRPILHHFQRVGR